MMEKLIPVDRHDPLGAKNATNVSFPKSFSARAWKAIHYLDDTIFLFYYKGSFVVTDESLYLTEHGDGTKEAPLGAPRFVSDTLDGVEAWLEYLADRYDEGEYPGWKKD